MLVTSVLLILPTLVIICSYNKGYLQTLHNVSDIGATIVISNFLIFNGLWIYHFVLKRVYNDICLDTGTDVGYYASRPIHFLGVLSLTLSSTSIIVFAIVFLGLSFKHLIDAKLKM